MSRSRSLSLSEAYHRDMPLHIMIIIGKPGSMLPKSQLGISPSQAASPATVTCIPLPCTHAAACAGVTVLRWHTIRVTTAQQHDPNPATDVSDPSSHCCRGNSQVTVASGVDHPSRPLSLSAETVAAPRPAKTLAGLASHKSEDTGWAAVLA
jgi:hypothetical protein